jgi:hypothetical protein
MEIRIRETGQVLYRDEWAKWVAQTHQRSISDITPEVLEMFGSNVILDGVQPTTQTPYQTIVRDGVEKIGNEWHIKYAIGPNFAEYVDVTGKTITVAEQEAAHKAAIDERQIQGIRFERNKRLAQTDWRFRSDLTPSQAWIDYCQALRDVPSQSGFPWQINWPVEPQ